MSAQAGVIVLHQNNPPSPYPEKSLIHSNFVGSDGLEGGGVKGGLDKPHIARPWEKFLKIDLFIKFQLKNKRIPIKLS